MVYTKSSKHYFSILIQKGSSAHLNIYSQKFKGKNLEALKRRSLIKANE